jgi:hypothetical protein
MAGSMFSLDGGSCGPFSGSLCHFLQGFFSGRKLNFVRLGVFATSKSAVVELRTSPEGYWLIFRESKVELTGGTGEVPGGVSMLSF